MFTVAYDNVGKLGTHESWICDPSHYYHSSRIKDVLKRRSSHNYFFLAWASIKIRGKGESSICVGIFLGLFQGQVICCFYTIATLLSWQFLSFDTKRKLSGIDFIFIYLQSISKRFEQYSCKNLQMTDCQL